MGPPSVGTVFLGGPWKKQIYFIQRALGVKIDPENWKNCPHFEQHLSLDCSVGQCLAGSTLSCLLSEMETALMEPEVRAAVGQH